MLYYNNIYSIIYIHICKSLRYKHLSTMNWISSRVWTKELYHRVWRLKKNWHFNQYLKILRLNIVLPSTIQRGILLSYCYLNQKRLSVKYKLKFKRKFMRKTGKIWEKVCWVRKAAFWFSKKVNQIRMKK